MKRQFVVLILIFWAVAWGWLVWPTPWRYEVEMWESSIENPDGTFGRTPVEVRIHRFTGEKQNRFSAEDEWGQYVW